MSGFLGQRDIKGWPRPRKTRLPEAAPPSQGFAECRAEELGFRTEVLWAGPLPGLSVSRLNGVLRARGIQGVIFLPFDQRQDFSEIDLSQLAAVSMDHRLIRLELHSIQADHYLSMRRCVDVLSSRGYKRIGFCMPRPGDERADYKWSDEVGFFRINHTERTIDCAGLDLRPEQLGATAVEAVVGMIHRRETGVPPCPDSISIDAQVVDGPTLRPV
jgi:hypothetical protein